MDLERTQPCSCLWLSDGFFPRGIRLMLFDFCELFGLRHTQSRGGYVRARWKKYALGPPASRVPTDYLSALTLTADYLNDLEVPSKLIPTKSARCDPGS